MNALETALQSASPNGDVVEQGLNKCTVGLDLPETDEIRPDGIRKAREEQESHDEKMFKQAIEDGGFYLRATALGKRWGQKRRGTRCLPNSMPQSARRMQHSKRFGLIGSHRSSSRFKN